jgi:hypothetical protein
MRKIMLILIVSLLVRLMLVPLNVQYAIYGDDVPHSSKTFEYCTLGLSRPNDFAFYTCIGQRFLDGKSVYTNYSAYPQVYLRVMYGPLFVLLMATLIKLFGVNYIIFKLVAVAADMLVIYLIYLVGRRVSSEDVGLKSAAIYSFTFLTLYSSGLNGSNNHLSLMFSLGTVYSLMQGNIILAGLISGLGMSTKLTVYSSIVPGIFYLRTIGKTKSIVKYLISIVVVIMLFALPFINDGVENVYSLNHDVIDGASTFNIIRIVYGMSYHYLYMPGVLLRDYNINDPMNNAGTNVFTITLFYVAKILVFVSLLVARYLILKFRIISRELEYVRNIVLFVALIMLTTNYVADMHDLVFLPFIIILIVHYTKIERLSIVGFSLVFLSVILIGVSWSTDTILSDVRIFGMVLSFILCAYGSYLVCRDMRILPASIMWVLPVSSIFSHVLFANPLYLIHDVVGSYVSLNTLRLIGTWGGQLVVAISHTILLLLMIYFVVKEVKK